MLAIFFGCLCFVAGLVILFLPILATELSRPRDQLWGAVVLLLGLILFDSRERLYGAPILAVLVAALLISRLGVEVAQSRWQQLSTQEQFRFRSTDRWIKSFKQLGEISANFIGVFVGLFQLLRSIGNKKTTGKKWIRQEVAEDKNLSDGFLEIDQAVKDSLPDKLKSPEEGLGVQSESDSSTKIS